MQAWAGSGRPEDRQVEVQDGKIAAGRHAGSGTFSGGDRHCAWRTGRRAHGGSLGAGVHLARGKQLKDWERLIAAADRVPIIAIINKDSGPGKQVDRNLLAVLERARQSTLTMIGYVPIKYAKRPIAEVKADVDGWLSLYPGVLSGIMFDEQPSGPEGVSYVAECTAYVRSRIKNAKIVSNPGTMCAPEYLAITGAPTICLFENKTGIDAYRPPSWRTKFRPAQMAVVLYDVPTAAAMKRSLREMLRKRAGYVYVTDDSGANPWDRLPSYWDEEVAAISAENQRAAGSSKKSRKGS